MAVLTANKYRLKVKPTGAHIKPPPRVAVDSDILYQFAILCYTATGLIAPAADTANYKFAGINLKQLTTGASNTLEAEFERGHIEDFVTDGNLDAADIGRNALILDDQTVTNAATATADVPLGEILDFYTGHVTVWTGRYAPVNAP